MSLSPIVFKQVPNLTWNLCFRSCIVVFRGTATERVNRQKGPDRGMVVAWVETRSLDTWAENFESLEWMHSNRETIFFYWCNSCKRLLSSRFPSISSTEFIRSKVSKFSAHVSGVMIACGLCIISDQLARLCLGVARDGGGGGGRSGQARIAVDDPGYMSRKKFESLERMNSIRETNGSFDSCKRLVPTRLHELHESKLPFVSRIEFIPSKLSNFSTHVSGVDNCTRTRVAHCVSAELKATSRPHKLTPPRPDPVSRGINSQSDTGTRARARGGAGVKAEMGMGPCPWPTQHDRSSCTSHCRHQ